MTLSHVNPNAYTRAHWAKSDRDDPGRIHLLEHHLADVGACMEALLSQPTIRGRLARAARRDDIDEATAARLAVFAALHDIGKVNVGFQTQIWQAEDWQGALRPRGWGRGHTRDIVPVLNYDDRETADWFFDALGFEELLEWDADAGETTCGLFVATLSHHGEPLNLEGGRQRNPSMWRAYGGLDPKACVERISGLARIWFPAAFARDAPPLPSAPPFQHMFLGLCTLADWLGSNENFFQFQGAPQDDYIATARIRAKRVVREIGLDISDQRADFGGAPSFQSLFELNAPNSIQQAASDAPLDEPLVVVESETGSGKTEAALWRFARMYADGLVDGLYFALPTRAAAVQIHGRVSLFAERMFTAADAPKPVLAAPGYIRFGDIKGERELQPYKVWWDSDATDHRRWAAESAKRFLAAQIAVGTIDQAMMAALKVRHSHMRAACLARNLLVVDEVHASDAYMRRILEALLDAHIGAGGYALLMSATLGSDARHRLLTRSPMSAMDAPNMDDAVKAAYPSVATVGEGIRPAGENAHRKRVRMEALPAMQDFDRTAQRALQAARAGATTLVIRNTVRNAIATQQAIERAAADASMIFTCNGTPTLHHGRFAAPDRHMLDAEVEALLGKDTPSKGCVVVGTQTLEQSLDIDADLLITDLCPADVLLQRIGRLHRHTRDNRPDGYGQARCIALTPSDGDLSPLLSKTVNGLGTVYKDLRILEATRRLIHENPEWRIPEMNRRLVERATHPTALEAITAELGDDWRVHANEVEGELIADTMTASGVVMRLDKTFYGDNQDVIFGSMEERIRTRLGDEGIEVEFQPPPKTPKSPFDASVSIEKLTIPAHLLRGQIADAATNAKPLEPITDDAGFRFSINGANFRYDRLGLRRLG